MIYTITAITAPPTNALLMQLEHQSWITSTPRGLMPSLWIERSVLSFLPSFMPELLNNMIEQKQLLGTHRWTWIDFHVTEPCSNIQGKNDLKNKHQPLDSGLERTQAYFTQRESLGSNAFPFLIYCLYIFSPFRRKKMRFFFCSGNRCRRPASRSAAKWPTGVLTAQLKWKENVQSETCLL